MTDHRSDPFEKLAMPVEPQTMRPAFDRSLRNRLASELGLDAEIPEVTLSRRNPMPSTEPNAQGPADSVAAPSVVTPYLTVSPAADAIEWYGRAFGAVEQFRVADDQGRLGHAELDIDGARVMLSDEHPELNVLGPASLGGTSVALHLTVADVDAVFVRAVDQGATPLSEPADQPHGARHGTLLDPYGHRWMLSQEIAEVSLDDYADRARPGGYHVERPRKPDGGVWSAVFYRDAMAGIRFLVDVLGFEERLVVPSPDGNDVVHSELVWPEGGVVQVGTYHPDNPYARPPGNGGLYLITADPQPLWERSQAAGVEVVAEPRNPDYDPDSVVFSIRDPEGNIFTVGSYSG